MTQQISELNIVDERVPISAGQLSLVAAGQAGNLQGIQDADSSHYPSRRKRFLFLGLFVLPVAVATLYFGVIAANVYVSEAKFIVRSSQNNDGGGLAVIMQNQGLSRAVDETNAIDEFVLSRDAALQLAKADSGLADLMAAHEGDIFNRFPNMFARDTQEQFYRAYRRFVSVEVDSATGISTLQIKAFRPADAQKLANALLSKAEQFVNLLNVRAHSDSVSFATELVKGANEKLLNVETRLATYRNVQSTIDPQLESEAAIEALGRLNTEISRLESSLAQQTNLAPDTPALASLRQRVVALRSEAQKQQKMIVGGPNSIASKLKDYEMLVLERELAVKGLTAATIELAKAQLDAQSQKVYIQRITQPNLPDQPTLPYRILWILTTAGVSYCIYWIMRSLIDSTMDHRT